MKTINKEKISQILRNKLGFSSSICETLVSDTFDSAIELLIKDKALKIKNFGSFSLYKKGRRPGMNMVTKEKIYIPERTVIKFVPSRNLKKELNRE